MWRADALGSASWQAGEQTWTVAAQGGDHGIAVIDPHNGDKAFRFEAVGADRLPVVAEQFVRGDSLHLNFPESDTAYSLRIVLRPLLATVDRLVIEVVLAIETSLLDAHPTLDIVVDGVATYPVNTADRAGSQLEPPGLDQQVTVRPSEHVESGGTAVAISQACRANSSVAVLLGPRDFPWTHDVSDDRELRLRLFGEFLEKGVIRKARPWIVLESGPEAGSAERLSATWQQLCASPLPLMA